MIPTLLSIYLWIHDAKQYLPVMPRTGGALATFAAYDLTMQLGIDSLRMYNFGSPRVGNQFWSLHYDAAVPLSFRVVYDGGVCVW